MSNLAHHRLRGGLEAARPSAGAAPAQAALSCTLSCTQRISTDPDRRQHRRLGLRALLELASTEHTPMHAALPGRTAEAGSKCQDCKVAKAREAGDREKAEARAG